MDEKAAEVLPGGLIDQLAHANWKERLAACERFKEVHALYSQEMFLCVLRILHIWIFGALVDFGALTIKNSL